MMTISKAQVRQMSPQERLAHYEQEKRELLSCIRNIPQDELQDAHAYLRRKWMV